MKTLTPLQRWMKRNKWTIQELSDRSGFHYQTVLRFVHCQEWPSVRALNSYWLNGIPGSVINDQVSHALDRLALKEEE